MRHFLLASVVLVAAAPAVAQEQVKPYFLVVVDTSGSMRDSTGVGTNSCGQSQTKMNDAKCVLGKIFNAYGDIVFGLGRFKQTSCTGTCNWGTGTCTDPADGPQNSEMLEPIAEDNQSQLLEWVDFTCATCSKAGTNSELDPGGGTPIASMFAMAKQYYEGNDPDFSRSPIAADPYDGCRPYRAIMLTDGNTGCGTKTQAINRAKALRLTTFGGKTYDIKSYVIGFGISPGDADIEAYAGAGGTDAPGMYKGFYATDETTLSLAFSQIIAESVLSETCDNADNDCDGLVDEGFAKYCDLRAGVTARTLCADPGDPCDGVDDNCRLGTSDEVKNACGACGPTPTEVCDALDNDCDGLIDEGGVCMGCVPQPEICDALDNDCDGMIDEGLARPCGSSVGECTPGTQVCASGAWGPCSGVGPEEETCDGLDNDCDGVVDGMALACGHEAIGQCLPGTTICVAGVFAPCVGGASPTTEVCDGLDNDCDGMIDQGNPFGGAPCQGGCGAGVTECVMGMLVCVGGAVGSPEECNGLDDDCDGLVDEDLGGQGPCSLDDAGNEFCLPGEVRCVMGGWHCVGGILPETEVCDCQDNDCDLAIDEGVLCQPGATCLGAPYCQCARPCANDEFPCPDLQVCTDPKDPTMGYCVPDPCAGIVCPPVASGELQLCVSGECVDVCSTIECRPPLVCRPSDGSCVEDNCNGFPERCAIGQFCVDGVCQDDPCRDVSCPKDQFCRDGICVESCANVTCPPGKSCQDGTCVGDPCAAVTCPASQVCDPRTGQCTSDRCIGRICPFGSVCDPVTGDCVEDPCLGVICPGAQVCRAGNCYDPAPSEGQDPATRTYLFASGGGGCGCRVGGGRAPMLAWALVLMALLIRRHRA